MKRLRCRQCATPLAHAGASRVCGDCLKHPPAFDATIVAADYVPPVDQLVLGLKFGGRLALASLCADMMREAWQESNPGGADLPACLIAVPLGSRRLIERGFNQSLEIARPLANALRIPVGHRMVVRTRDTDAQTRLQPDQRRQNIRGAFAVTPDAVAGMHGRHVGVVDDVITTGGTLHEVAATLKRFGAARVTNFVFARTVSK